MNATFYSPDPHLGSMRALNRLLAAGTDQIAICCAYCTAAGVDFLRPHAARLSQPGSYIVVSWEKPTNFDALEELHALIPGNLYVHFGNTTPYERQVGGSKMHSKVFYSRSSDRCQLWTGSHNLTGSALLGANCEAAIHIEGTPTDGPFRDALQHLEACRLEAHPFYPGMRGPDEIDLQRQPTIIIHAEGVASSPPGPVYLRVCGTHLDKDLTPPASVRLYLYAPGSLARGWQNTYPQAAFSGQLTGVNLTPNHPSYSGTSATWPTAHFAVDIPASGATPTFGPIRPDPPRMTTQAMFMVDASAPLDEAWLQKKPRSKMEPVNRPPYSRAVDDNALLKYFSKASVSESGELVFRTIEVMEPTFEVPADEIREDAAERLSGALKTRLNRKEKQPWLGKDFEGQAPFVYRANFRI